ncbi:TIGR01212 family radical SAM protein [bacterium]|nr:TIGR01212 family radical SAM protein [candidate division CSSED10-310 bacterium]
MADHAGNAPYRKLNPYLRERFGGRVWRVSIQAGLTCPNRDGTLDTAGCVFCDNRAFSPRLEGAADSVTVQLDNAIPRLADRYKAEHFIAYFQSFTNTYGDPERLATMYREAAAHQRVVAVAVSTRPDCITPEIVAVLTRLQRVKPVWVELGMQSAHDASLTILNRRHTVTDTINANSLLRAAAIEVVLHLIIGLPGEDDGILARTAAVVTDLDVQGVKLHHLHAVEGTLLAQWYRSGAWRPTEWRTYLGMVVDFLERIPHRVVIHRLLGDCPSKLLVAPRWTIDKAGFLIAVEAEFKRRGTRQGSRCGNDTAGVTPVEASQP